MTAKTSSLFDRVLLLAIAIIAVFTSWIAIRSWLITGLSISARSARFADLGVVFATGILATIFFGRLILSPVASYVGPTSANAVKSLLQLVGLGLVALVASSLLGFNIVSALVGIGFFGLVVGLAAQQVLGNLLSGIMLLTSRPFRINDRVAMITWQYGKFPPSLSHGWLEPSYTGVVKGISLLYTQILIDSGALLKVPNGIMTQSLVLNLSHDRRTRIGTQFEVPIQIDPDDLHKSLNTYLAKMSDFKGDEDAYEVVEIAPTVYLASVSYQVEKRHEREMKAVVLRAVRQALLSLSKETK